MEFLTFMVVVENKANPFGNHISLAVQGNNVKKLAMILSEKYPEESVVISAEARIRMVIENEVVTVDNPNLSKFYTDVCEFTQIDWEGI